MFGSVLWVLYALIFISDLDLIEGWFHFIFYVSFASFIMMSVKYLALGCFLD